jgi:NTE family protein
MLPLIACGEIDKLKEVYTSITAKDIFSLYPFIIKKSKGAINASINHLGILRQLLKGGKTFGDSRPLRNLRFSVAAPERKLFEAAYGLTFGYDTSG